ncbi:MAG: CDP-diacylglycerol--serine O-phosphatidyltransferase [Sandaracinaceae bacterium]|nr:CDP-diacylglycerol--serine O-phosphatidyltransferase [Sandaracinaceae bacterium]MDW8247260.1 CDP-diacylglycerol--serine O-phosphatidyltransferase [Sandaracinaceae bacterium]
MFVLPNLFTLSSIFCSFLAILSCLEQPTNTSIEKVGLLVLFSFLFDAIDGRIARLTKTQSAFGVELDSLADVIAFGLVPALLAYRHSLHLLGPFGVFIGFVFVACGAIRLARFNVLSTTRSGTLKKPNKYFLGLPIPAAAVLAVSFIVVNGSINAQWHSDPHLIGGLMLLLSTLMVSTLRFRSLKSFKWSTRKFFIGALVLGIAGAVAINSNLFLPLFVVMSSYVIFGILEAAFDIVRRIKGKPSGLTESDTEENQTNDTKELA